MFGIRTVLVFWLCIIMRFTHRFTEHVIHYFFRVHNNCNSRTSSCGSAPSPRPCWYQNRPACGEHTRRPRVDHGQTKNCAYSTTSTSATIAQTTARLQASESNCIWVEPRSTIRTQSSPQLQPTYGPGKNIPSRDSRGRSVSYASPRDALIRFYLFYLWRHFLLNLDPVTYGSKKDQFLQF